LLLNKRIVILSVSLAVVLLFITATIYVLNMKTTGSPLMGYESLKNKIQAAKKINSVSNHSSFNTMLELIASLDNENLTKEQQLSRVRLAWGYLFDTYSETNNHELYNLSKEYKKFGEANFNDFKINVQCLDPDCAETPTSQEILGIIEEINTSTVAANFKTSYVQDLKTFSYINNSQAEVKVKNYLTLADSIKVNEEFIKAGNNLIIYDQIRQYVQKNYPELYKKWANHVFIGNTQ